jgi:hypothetical protein
LLNSGAPCGRVERCTRRRIQAAPKPPPGPRESEIRDRRKPDLVGPQGKQQMRDPIRYRQI